MSTANSRATKVQVRGPSGGCVTLAAMVVDPARATPSLVHDRDAETTLYRNLPHNTEAEQALLGAILINNEAFHRTAGFLLVEHFFEPVHGRIYDAAAKLIERNHVATPVTLKQYFENDDALADVGGAQYLARLAGAAVTIINAEDYGRVIHDLALRRELIGVGEEMVNTAYDSTVDDQALEQIERSEQRLFNLVEHGQQEGGFVSFHTALSAAIDMAESAHRRDGRTVGVGTGFKDLDAKLGGLHRSDLIILAGRPSMGKTALATNIALNAALAYRTEKDEHGKERVVDGAAVGFFSLEMAAEQIATRILAEASNVPADAMRRGAISDDDFVKVVPAAQRLEQIPFFIDDTPTLTIAALRTRARRLKRRHGLGLIIVDYLQLMRAVGRYDNRVLEIAEVTRGLKALAKDLDVPVLALSQLSRAVEQREDKRPLLSDLRESGAIEQDADVVMFIYREEYYLVGRQPEMGTDEHLRWQERMESVHGLAEVIIGKQRHGPIGAIKLQFAGETTKFSNYAAASQLPADSPL